MIIFAMGHGHHHEHMHVTGSMNRVFVFSIVLNAAFVAVEAAVGLMSNSLGLLSDAGHNLGDVFSLLLAMFAFRLARVHSSPRYTYGYKKSTVLISLLNAIILLVAVGAIVAEAIRKFQNPSPVEGAAVSWTAGIGIFVNGLTAWMLMRGSSSDLNVRGAFLHMAADTLVSAGVLVSGIVISVTGWSVIDPVVSLVVAAVILLSTWHLLSESLRLSLDGMPAGLEMEAVAAAIQSAPGVESVHHIHVWAISTSENALTAHLVLSDGADQEAAKDAVRKSLSGLGIGHVTLETEPHGRPCHCESCV